MGKAKLANLKKCSQIVLLAPTRPFNTTNIVLLNNQNQEIDFFSGTKILPNLEFFSRKEGVFYIKSILIYVWHLYLLQPPTF